MPEIPRFKPQPTIEEPAPTMAGVKPAIQLAERGRRYAVQAFETVEKGLTDYFEKERKAKLAVKSMEAENTIDEDMNTAWLGIQQRSDYDKIPADLEKTFEQYQKKYTDMAGGDKQLGFAINAYYQKSATKLRNQTRVHVAGLISNKGMAEFLKKEKKFEDEYIMNPDPEVRKDIIENYKTEINNLVAFNILKKDVAQARINAFEKTIQGKAIDFADVAADKAIESNPQKAFIDLADSNYLPDLQPKQRQDKSEKAKRTIKVKEAEQENKQKEAIRLGREKEEQEMARLYGAKEYSQLYARAESNKILEGHRMQHWMDAAEMGARKEEKIESIVESSEYAFINQLMAKDVNPRVIQDSIIISPRLRETTKTKLLDRLEKQQDKEINRAASRSYEYMKQEIINPKGIAGTMAKFVSPETRGNNYAKAQLALDDWIDKQILLEKPITGNDILKKAEELVQIYRPKLNQNSPIIQKKTNDMIQSLNELGDLSKGKQIPIAPTETKSKAKKYNSIEEVKAAYGRKEITYEEAAQILKTDFGIK